jgi:hypothetical protein
MIETEIQHPLLDSSAGREREIGGWFEKNIYHALKPSFLSLQPYLLTSNTNRILTIATKEIPPIIKWTIAFLTHIS